MTSQLPFPEEVRSKIRCFVAPVHPTATMIKEEREKYYEMIYWYFDTFAEWFPDWDEVYRWREMRNLRILIDNTQAQYDWASKWDVLDTMRAWTNDRGRYMCSLHRLTVRGVALNMSEDEEEED